MEKKKSQNLIDALEKSKNCELASFIYALGIPNVGKKTAKDLANEYKSMENLINSSFESLINIPEIGDIVAKSIIDFLSWMRL